MKKLPTSLLLGTAFFGGCLTSQAAITVANSVSGVTQNNSAATVGVDGVLFTTSSFDMTGGNTVALLVTTEGSGTSSTHSATFAGQALTEVYVEDNGAGVQTAAIYYLINPTITSGQFVFSLDSSFSGTVDFAYSIISLAGVSGLAGSDTNRSTSTANTTPLNVNYTTTTDGGYVLGAAANNDFNNTRQLSIDTGNPDTNLLSHTLIDTSGHFHTHGDVATAGSYTDGYLGQYQRTGVATVAFNAIPEPGVALLSGLGTLLLVRRRRVF